jgi:hypothetical protein
MFDDLARLGSSAAGDYEIEKSLRFDEAGQSYLSRTFGSNSSDTSKTFSCWVKRSTAFNNYQTIAGTTQDGYLESRLQFANNGALKFTDRDSSSGSTDANFYTVPRYTDCSAWYHVVLIIDTTNGTSGDRLRIYVNGSRVTSLTSETQPTQNYAVQFMRSNAVNFIGAGGTSTTDDFGGYLADIYFFDGSILEPSNFGKTNPTTGQWIPKAYSGAGYGTNGFHLKFDDNSNVTAATLGKDSAGSNDWTPNSFSVTANSVDNDSVLDTPTNNWVTMNQSSANPSMTVSDGGLYMKNPNTGDYPVYATQTLKAGKKYYIEGVYLEPNGSGSQCYWGITLPTFNNGTPTKPNSAGSYSFDWRGGSGTPTIHNNGSSSTTGSRPANGSVIGMVIDLSAGKMYVHDDNSYYESGNPGAGSGAIITGISTTTDFNFIAHVDAGGPNVSESKINFGQQGFQYQPSGFEDLLNTQSMADPTITEPTDHFNTILYTGNATSRNIVSGFDTGLVWIKRRSGQEGHVLANRVIGADSFLSSNSTAAVNTANNCVTAFNSDGVTVGTQGIVNDNNETFVSWHWKAAGAASTNSTGTINVSLIANPTAGFSIGTYGGNDTGGATIGHGLGVAPDVVIVKWTNGGDNWCVYNKNNGDGKTLWLDSDGVVPTGSSYYSSFWNDTAPSSTVTTLGSNGAVNGSSRNYLVLSFASVEGYSKFGSYTGNGSTDGTYVYLGFKPAYVLVKRINGGPNYWNQHDHKRNPSNVVNTVLYPNSDDDEESYAVGTAGSPNKNFYSNGFKLESTHSEVNGSGDTYFYMAFAETPFKYATAR